MQTTSSSSDSSKKVKVALVGRPVMALCIFCVFEWPIERRWNEGGLIQPICG